MCPEVGFSKPASSEISAVGTDDTDKLAGSYAERNIINNRLTLYLPTQIAGFNNGLRRGNKWLYEVYRHLFWFPLIRMIENAGAPTKAVITPMGSTWPGSNVREITSATMRKMAPVSALTGSSR